MMKFAPYITIYDFDESADIQNEVIWTFSSFLKGISSVRQRINIHVVRDIKNERHNLDGSIKSVWKYFPIENYLSASYYEQKQLLLDLITSSFMDVSYKLDWNQKSIIEAKENCIKQNIQFHYTSKLVKHKTSGLSARIELELLKDKVSIWVLFSTKNNQELIKKHLIDTPANQISAFRNFNRPEWINNSQFGFRFKNGLTLSISTDDNEKVWSEMNSKMDEYFKKQIDYNEKLSPEELAKLVNW